MPADNWFRIPGRPYVLTDGPDTLVTHREDEIEVETVLARISKENYQILKDARIIEHPNEESLVTLRLIMNESVVD